MSSPIFVNDLPYRVPEENPLESLKSTLAFAVDDWGDSRAKAWVYGIVLGWGSDDDDPDAHAELAAKFGWDDAAVARLRRLHAAFEALDQAGLVVVEDEPHHYVTFDEYGWFIEHSVACRIAGTIGTCTYNEAVRGVVEDFDPNEDPDQLGRWRITDIDDEGLPSLERVEVTDGK